MQTLFETLREFKEELATYPSVTWAYDRGERRAPEPPSEGLLGHLPSMARDNMECLERWWRSEGDIYRLRFAFATHHVVVHPRHIKQVLQENSRAYSKRTHSWRTLSLIVGTRSVLTTDGDTWLRQRRVSQPEFNRRKIESFLEVMNTCADEITKDWSDLEAGSNIDAAAEMSRVTLEIISRAAFGREMGVEQASSVRHAVHRLTDDVNRRISQVFGRFVQLPGARNREFRKQTQTLDETVYSMIEERRTHPGRDDLLTRLLEARDPQTGEQMSDAQLHDEVMTIFLAGHETTAQLLSWTWLLLAQNPEWETHLHEELDQQIPDGVITIDALKRLDVLYRILQESLRLYPPAWSTDRGVEIDDEIDGILIPKGSVVLIPIWLLHRHPDYWDEPERFNPDRFIDGPKERWAYIPFGAGPRLCLGQSFAMQEAMIVMATLARRFELRLAGPAPKPVGAVTLRPDGGLPMTIKPRATHRAES